jgi:hypothetical protein
LQAWESHQQAKAMFKRALDLDPAFTPAINTALCGDRAACH